MKKGSNRTRLVIGLTSIMLAASPIYAAASVSAAGTAAPAITAVSKVVKPVYINSKSYMNLVDVTLAPSEHGQTAAFTLSIYNGGTTALDMSDYWFRLTSSNGGKYSLKSQSENDLTTKVQPGSKIFITLYADTAENTKLADLILNIVKFDFSTANYEQGIGSFKVPSNYTNVVIPGSYKTLYYNNTILNSKVSSASLGSSGDNNYVTVNFVYNNIGKKAITLTNYKYYIVTAEGAMYPATSSESDSLVLNPMTRKEFQLTAAVPASLKTTGWKLVVLNGSDEKVTLPVGAYQLLFKGETTSTASTSFVYSNSTGKYQFDLVQLQREPWDNQDVLAARIRITNKSSDSVDLPELSGYFYLDNKVKLNFTPVASSNQFGLNADGSIDVDVYAKLPNNYSFNNVRMVVNQKSTSGSNTTETKMGELAGSSASIPIYAVDKPYTITRDGSQMSGLLNAVNIYNTTTSKLFTAQMTLTSNEKRSIDPVKLAAFFENDNGDIFPATVSLGEGKVNPLNKALVTFSASLPESYDTHNLRLIVGEGVADTKYADAASPSSAYVNATVFNLPNEQRTFGTFKDVPLLPYSFSVNTFTSTVLGDNLQVTLNYDLNKDTQYNVYPTDRKLVMTIDAVDTNDGTEYQYFTQDLTLEGDGASALQAGTGNKIVFSKPNPYHGIDARLLYKVRLYEVVNGAKKLLVERPLGYWFIDNDWSKDAPAGQ